MHDDQIPEDSPEYDLAEQAAAEDGFTSLAAYLAQRPMPRQRDRSAA